MSERASVARALAVIGLLSLWLAAPAHGEKSAIGRIKTLEGDVTIERGGRAADAKLGTEVFEKDIVKTGENGKTGITFLDQTRLAIGPESEIQLKEYEFTPANKKYSFITKITRGTMLFVSGLIAKLSPSSALVETPGGTIGVRGTSFVVRVKGD